MTTTLAPAENTAELAGPFPVHPAAELFPLMQGADFDAFVEDIRVNGQQEPVVLDADGRLLDGRNRARACTSLGLRITTRRYDGDDPMQFVISHNLHRRHLTDSQRAMIAAELATLQMGRPPVSPPSGGLTSLTAAEVQALMQVSDTGLYRAKVIHREGTPELQALAKEISLPLETAARVARTSPAEQDAYVQQIRAGADPVKAAPPVDLAARHDRRRVGEPPGGNEPLFGRSSRWRTYPHRRRGSGPHAGLRWQPQPGTDHPPRGHRDVDGLGELRLGPLGDRVHCVPQGDDLVGGGHGLIGGAHGFRLPVRLCGQLCP